MSEFRECVGETKRLHSDNDELRVQILDLHIRSMGDNPLFNGVPETDNENTESVLQDVLKKQMKIEKKKKKKKSSRLFTVWKTGHETGTCNCRQHRLF